MIPPEQLAEIRRLFFAEHWKLGTIASALGLHPDTVRRAVQTERFNEKLKTLRPSRLDPYVNFIRETLERYPRLRATRIHDMIRSRGYEGSAVQVRRLVARLRPVRREPFLALRAFPGEEGQADWAHFGVVQVGRARRKLSGFVLALSYSRALAVSFFFDQSLENFLRGHVHAFSQLGGCPRTILYDNLRSAVLQRHGDAVQFHPRLLELCAHYHFAPRPCAPARGNEKGRVERAIRYVRDSFFAARPFTTLEDFNRQARVWCEHVAQNRRWPGDDTRSVAQALDEERPRLLPLPSHPFDTDLVLPVHSGKTIYVRFDLNDYSIPPEAVQRPLTIVASESEVRILDGARELTRHRRSYDRHQLVTDPAHQQALLAHKRRALGATPNGRLLGAVPEVEALLEAAVGRGESAVGQTARLLQLLDDYGAAELRHAVHEALERETPRVSSVAYLLQRRRRRAGHRPLAQVSLTHRPELTHLHVEPQDLETYDDLARDDDPDR
ncbi:MAG TPA: IS21 family transposase [Steroidobacteraceae bacterium]|nr:IS21 family transposase [Steroidobacteraceae bacterium]